MADVSDELRNDSMESERRSLTGAFVRLPDGTAAFILEDQEDRWRFRAFNASNVQSSLVYHVCVVLANF